MEKVFKSQRLERMEITIGEAKPILREIEMEKHLNSDQITKDAILVIKAAIAHAALCVPVDYLQVFLSRGLCRPLIALKKHLNSK